MRKSIRVITKKRRGRPKTTGTGTLIGLRLLDAPLAALDEWITRQGEKGLSRPEAIRRLVELGLNVKAKSKPLSDAFAHRAKELATRAVDTVIDPSISQEERDRRRRRLTKGPPEFRDDRVDQPKAKTK
jgi:hypothetical protein